MSKKNRTDNAWESTYAPFLAIPGYPTMPNQAVQRQALIENMYIRILTELAVNRYAWYGLPESINPMFMELMLARNALAVFYDEESINNYLALQGTPSGQLNYQNDPIKFTVYGNQFINKELNAMPSFKQIREKGKFTGEFERIPEQCVPIWANALRRPDWDIITVYASRLSEMDRTIEINSKNARRTKVIAVDPNMGLSVENIERQINEGQPVIKVNQVTFDDTIGGMSAIDLGVDPRTIEPLQLARTRTWNECMGLLGINNANQDKKERLVANEVDANNDQVDSMRNVALNARRQAAHMINVRYGLKVGVEFHNQNVFAPDPMVAGYGDDDNVSRETDGGSASD